jgi:RsiW-degrading membrane proteinase PrsW (M82 family)
MLLVSFIGELVKLIVPTLFIFGGKNYSELGCIVIGAVTGAGFAVLEAMGYGLGALLFTGGGITDANHVLLVRVLVAPAVHIAWTALAADALWHLRGGTNHAVLRCVTTVLGVVLLHALWNNTTPLAWLMSGIVGVASLGWLAVRVRRAVHGSQSGLTSLVAALTLM